MLVIGAVKTVVCYQGTGRLKQDRLRVAVGSPKAGGLQTQFRPLPGKGRSVCQLGGQRNNRNPEKKDTFLLEFLSL